ncbi:ATP-binding cassette domain-containing protein [bacterium 1xD42-67]|nr:ATP-binding cassette domain-containing protein [bacterium 1xD42-67]
MPLIETRDLKKYFDVAGGKLHAVDGVSLSIERGRTLGVVGESGCGKSTFGRVVLRLLDATSGQVLYNGEDILKYSNDQMMKMRQKMQIIFQDPYASLNPRMTVSEIIAEPIRVRRTIVGNSAIMDKVDELMQIVGLADRFVNTYPHELDGGRRQRIGIARALALDPEFIVCDEPVSALDVSIQAQVLNLLMDLQEERGLTYLFVTHNLSVVKHISDEIAVMYLGQCVERCPSDELFENPLHPYTRALLSAIPEPTLEARNKRQEIIRGEVTSPIDPKPGCRFAARCPHAKPECMTDSLRSQEISPGHFVSCLLYR